MRKLYLMVLVRTEDDNEAREHVISQLETFWIRYAKVLSSDDGSDEDMMEELGRG